MGAAAINDNVIDHYFFAIPSVSLEVNNFDDRGQSCQLDLQFFVNVVEMEIVRHEPSTPSTIEYKPESKIKLKITHGKKKSPHKTISQIPITDTSRIYKAPFTLSLDTLPFGNFLQDYINETNDQDNYGGSDAASKDAAAVLNLGFFKALNESKLTLSQKKKFLNSVIEEMKTLFSRDNFKKTGEKDENGKDKYILAGRVLYGRSPKSFRDHINKFCRLKVGQLNALENGKVLMRRDAIRAMTLSHKINHSTNEQIAEMPQYKAALKGKSEEAVTQSISMLREKANDFIFRNFDGIQFGFVCIIAKLAREVEEREAEGIFSGAEDGFFVNMKNRDEFVIEANTVLKAAHLETEGNKGSHYRKTVREALKAAAKLPYSIVNKWHEVVHSGDGTAFSFKSSLDQREDKEASGSTELSTNIRNEVWSFYGLHNIILVPLELHKKRGQKKAQKPDYKPFDLGPITYIFENAETLKQAGALIKASFIVLLLLNNARDHAEAEARKYKRAPTMGDYIEGSIGDLEIPSTLTRTTEKRTAFYESLAKALETANIQFEFSTKKFSARRP